MNNKPLIPRSNGKSSAYTPASTFNFGARSNKLVQGIIKEDVGIVNAAIKEGVDLNKLQKFTVKILVPNPRYDPLGTFSADANKRHEIYKDSIVESYPLLFAIREKKSLLVIRALLDGGASLNYGGKSSILNLIRDDNITKLLIEYGADYSGMLIKFIYDGRFKSAALIIEKGADVNGSGNDIPLIAAINIGNIEIVKLLIDKGANLDGSGDQIPLKEAALRGNREIIKLLIDKGAERNVEFMYLFEDGTKKTPVKFNLLELACFIGSKELIRLFIENKIKFNNSILWTIVRAAKIHHDYIRTHGNPASVINDFIEDTTGILDILYKAGDDFSKKEHGERGDTPLELSNYYSIESPELFKPISEHIENILDKKGNNGPKTRRTSRRQRSKSRKSRAL